MKRKKVNRSRLDLEDRILFQACIAKGMAVKDIAKRLKCHISTIYREIHRNHKKVDKKKYCSPCPKLKNKAFLCNNCLKRGFCLNEKRYYDYYVAQEKSNNRKVISRSHLKKKEDEVNYVNNALSIAILDKGQSLHHAYVSDPKLMTICSENTIRRWIIASRLKVKVIDLKRFVTRKRQYEYDHGKYKRIRNIARLDGRLFKDFKAAINKNSRLSIVQLDSVEGLRTDEKAILTVYIKRYHFQFGILYNRENAASEVLNSLKKIFEIIGNEKAKQVFAICLADNGPEFDRLHELELDSFGEKIIQTFFTRPYKSSDKGACEKNHEFFRYIFPKGNSMNDLTQDDVNLIFSHINSIKRESLGNKSPYELVVKRLGIKFTKALGIDFIPEKDVCMKPSLLKTKKK